MTDSEERQQGHAGLVEVSSLCHSQVCGIYIYILYIRLLVYGSSHLRASLNLDL